MTEPLEFTQAEIYMILDAIDCLAGTYEPTLLDWIRSRYGSGMEGRKMLLQLMDKIHGAPKPIPEDPAIR